MAIVQGPTNSFKQEVLQKQHNLVSDVLKIALYSSSASLGAETTVYTTTGEVIGTGYSAGGATLAGAAINISQGVVYIDFTDATWPASTITARGALIYNASAANKSVWALNFGSDRSSSASTLTVKFPNADADSAIFRFG